MARYADGEGGVAVFYSREDVAPEFSVSGGRVSGWVLGGEVLFEVVAMVLNRATRN